MKFLNAQQLAYILQIKKSDARIRMCNAWGRDKGIEKEFWGGEKTIVAKVKRKGTKVEDEFPPAMPIDMLARELNLPHLQQSADDIEHNYIKRNASRKYILWDFPEKQMERFKEECKPLPYSLQIPPALRSMLPESTVKEIYQFWKDKHELNLTIEEYNERHPKTSGK